MFRFDNLKERILSDKGKKIENYIYIVSLILGFLVYCVLVVLCYKSGPNAGVIDFIPDIEENFNVYVLCCGGISLLFGIFVYKFLMFFVNKRYSFICEYSAEVEVTSTGVYVTYLNDNSKIFFDANNSVVTAYFENTYTRKALNPEIKDYLLIENSHFYFAVPQKDSKDLYDAIKSLCPVILKSHSESK